MAYDAKSSNQSAMVECESIHTKMDFASVIWDGIIDYLPRSADVQRFKKNLMPFYK